MKVEIETKDNEILLQLEPLIEVAKNYKGHFNASYTAKNTDYIVQDNIHKKTCMGLLNKVNKGFVIGSGGGHIWVSLHTASRITDKYPLSVNGMDDRLLLITDEN